MDIHVVHDLALGLRSHRTRRVRRAVAVRPPAAVPLVRLDPHLVRAEAARAEKR